jgi:hypothetical protein
MDKTRSTQQKRQGSITKLEGQRSLERPRLRWVNINVMMQNRNFRKYVSSCRMWCIK